MTAAAAVRPQLVVACRLCGVRLGADDDQARGVCSSCSARPEARRLGTLSASGSARAFTSAERSLIRAIGGSLPSLELLKLLNERLHADLGPDAAPYTADQLAEALQGVIDPGQAGDWSGLRRLLADARRSGVLALLTPTVVDDFVTVFQLTPAQRTHVRDVLAHAREVV